MIKIKFNEEQKVDLVKMKQKSYEIVEQFKDDIKRFVHQCCSIYPQSEIQEASEKLIAYINEHSETINACTECYQNLLDYHENGSIKKQCSSQHVLIWAKSQKYDSYWPAKVLAVNCEEETVRIQFFGDHSCWSLPTKDDKFYLYSTKRPETKTGPRPKPLSKALEVSLLIQIRIVLV